MGFRKIMFEFGATILRIVSYFWIIGGMIHGCKRLIDNYRHEKTEYESALMLIRQCRSGENSGAICANIAAAIEKSPFLEALSKTWDLSLLCFGSSCSYFFKGLTEGWTLFTLLILLCIIFLIFSLKRHENSVERSYREGNERRFHDVNIPTYMNTKKSD